MNILVTGADGFLGSEICLHLEKEGCNINRFVRNKKFSEKNVPTQRSAGTLFGDITEAATFSEVRSIPAIDVLVHTAGLAHQFGQVSDRQFWDVNVRGTENIAKLAVDLKVKHFVQISSVAVYGSSEAVSEADILDENSPCHPADIYALTKYEAEKVCMKILDQENIDLTILRPATIIGEGDAGNVFRLIKTIDAGKFIWVGRGQNKKSLIYKNDVARSVAFVIGNKNHATEIFNVSAEPISMKDIVSEISKHLDRRIFPYSIPVGIPLGVLRFLHTQTGIDGFGRVANSLQKWISNDVYSADKLFASYGFQPKVSVAEALRREVAWYSERKL